MRPVVVHGGGAAINRAMAEAGVMVGGERLRPSSAGTTVRTTNGKTQVLDGPYAETKDVIGGYTLVTAKDLSQAAEFSKGCPIFESGGLVEVRPIMEM